MDDFEHFEEREVRYFDGDSNPAIYTPTADWTTTEASGKQMISDMASMISMLTSRGLPATDVLVAPDVADIILSNEWILNCSTTATIRSAAWILKPFRLAQRRSAA